MRNRKKDMNQVLTYWAPTGKVVFGVVELAPPVLLACRWQGRASQFLDTAGVQRVSRAVVYPESPVAVGGVIALGDWLASTGKPREIKEAQEVAQTGSSPSLKGDEVLHKVWV